MKVTFLYGLCRSGFRFVHFAVALSGFDAEYWSHPALDLTEVQFHYNDNQSESIPMSMCVPAFLKVH